MFTHEFISSPTRDSLRGSRANSLGPLYGLEKASTFINSMRVLEEKIFSFKGDLKTKQKTSFSICDVSMVEDKTCNNWFQSCTIV